eukprot:904579-Pyramimonas_sp.AAC.1
MTTDWFTDAGSVRHVPVGRARRGHTASVKWPASRVRRWLYKVFMVNATVSVSLSLPVGRWPPATAAGRPSPAPPLAWPRR